MAYETVDATNTTIKSDIVDIRGRIVPDLREHTNAIAANVQRLKDPFGSFVATNLSMTVSCIEERLDAFRTEFDEYT